MLLLKWISSFGFKHRKVVYEPVEQVYIPEREDEPSEALRFFLWVLFLLLLAVVCLFLFGK